MNPLETYLNQVRVRLPRKRRDETMEELRGALMDLLERRKAELGRALTADQERKTLRGFGHPYAIAAGYWTGQGLLGGPFTLYYRRTLFWSFVVIVASQLLMAAWRAAQTGSLEQALAVAIAAIISSLILAFGVATAVFMMLDAARGRQKRGC